MYHNEHVLNCDKISCRKIPLNFGLLFQNLIYIGNQSTLLQLLILNKAYYLEIKIGLINESHQIFPPCSHFGITIFEQEFDRNVRKRENAGSLCIKHGTLTKVSHYITLHHIVFCHIIRYHILSNYHTKYCTKLYQIASRYTSYRCDVSTGIMWTMCV